MALTKVQIGMTDAPTSGTAVTASGTSVDFNSIPSTAKRITVMFGAVSGNGSSVKIVQIGTSGGIQTTGYVGASQEGATGTQFPTNGLSVEAGTSAATIINGIATLTLLDATTGIWAFSGSTGRSTTASATTFGGSKTLSGVLDRVRITTANGTDTFDAGTINIMWE